MQSYEVSITCDMDDMESPQDAARAFMAWLRDDVNPTILVRSRENGHSWTIAAEKSEILREWR